ncbi:IS110 family transposase [Streptomyces osmaniensis]|uniref:IS110 family transposase n=1 Tax=Streptomyces osmaniensis TaxID=593134 RepID=A0ABP6Z281_9ACTN
MGCWSRQTRSNRLEHARQSRLWVGIDAGKRHHWAVTLDVDGETLFSTKVTNALIETARERADEVRWVVDISGRASTLLLALLVAHEQQVVHVPGRTVNRMSGAYRGESKTAVRHARVIADQARMRPHEFALLDIPPELVSTLRLLTNHRADLVADRVRLINRLRGQLVGSVPRWSGHSTTPRPSAPVVMSTEYQNSAALRRIGVKRLTAWLEHRKVRSADTVAAQAVEAAQSQQITLPGEKRSAERAEEIKSMPGMGPTRGAEFGAIVGDLSGYRDAGRLTSHGGLAPVARVFGRRTGNYHRP